MNSGYRKVYIAILCCCTWKYHCEQVNIAIRFLYAYKAFEQIESIIYTDRKTKYVLNNPMII